MTGAVGLGVAHRALRRRDRSIVVSAAVAATALAWLVLVANRAHHPATAAAWSYAVAFGMWLTMMVAMMLPPVLPWIVLYGTTSRSLGGADASVRGGTLVFAGGYLVVWSAFCVVAAGAQIGLSLTTPALFDGERLGATAAGGVLALAGVFQLSGLKAACLRHCRNPIGFFLARWNDGPTGAFRMGATHGMYCLGCCWALMLVSFAVGVMNLLWMAALTVMLCLEKIAPGGRRLGRVFGGALIGAGAWTCL